MTPFHVSTKRDYQARATDEKPKFSAIAKKFDFDFWDGDRKTGYGGYSNDGRWARIANFFLNEYPLDKYSKVLDIGCGKGFLLEEFQNIRSDLDVIGIDVSAYAIENASPKIKSHLKLAPAQTLHLPDKSIDLVVSINTLHNLKIFDLQNALKEIERVKKQSAYICVESYRNEEEKWNLMRWQLTCECFYSPDEWEWIFKTAGYSGDYEFIFFE